MYVFNVSKIVVNPSRKEQGPSFNVVQPANWRPAGRALASNVDVYNTYGVPLSLEEGGENILGLDDTPSRLMEYAANKVRPQIDLAEKFLGNAEKVLNDAGKQDLAGIMTGLYPIALPRLIVGKHGNPVHHTLKVLEIMSKIGIGEGLTYTELKIACAAALLHDSGFERTSDKKIRRADIDQIKDQAEKEKALLDAIQSRKKHMLTGATVAWEVLSEFNALHADDGLAFSRLDIRRIQEIVRRHDDPTVEELTGSNSGEWLFLPEEKLLLMHREADRLWMVTPEGLEADLVKDKVRDPLARLLGNIKRHEEEFGLYEKAFGNETAGFGFRTGSYATWFAVPEGIKAPSGKPFYSNKTSIYLFQRYLIETVKAYNIYPPAVC